MLDAANVRRMVEDAAIMDESNTKEKHTIKGRHTEFTRVRSVRWTWWVPG
jgi:hypothetical protein